MSRTLFQAAPLQSLMLGNYYGFITLKEILEHGDTGMGTLDGLDGEMIILDGIAYQAKADGTIATPDITTTSPFGCAAHFESDMTVYPENADSLAGLSAMLTAAIPENDRNLFYMAKITGTFKSLLLRSVARQKEPYLPINGAMKNDQQVFTLENTEGTAVALYCPNYMDRVNMHGWHLHFITADRKRGGHVLDIRTGSVAADICTLDRHEMRLPRNGIFGQLDITAVSKDDVCKAEYK